MARSSLVIRNLLCNRRRSVLTVVSIALSMLPRWVFGATYRCLQAPRMPSSFANLLLVASCTSLLIPLPVQYGERIGRLPGANVTSPVNMVDALYGTQEESLLWLLAFQRDKLEVLMPEWHLPPAARNLYH
jgi:hypothetical protein